METGVLAALLTAAASLLVAIISGVFSLSAKRIALKAEEESKRSEQIRLKATEAGEELLKTYTEIIIPAEAILFLLEHRDKKALTEEESQSYFQPIGDAVSRIRSLMYSTSLYTSPSIRSEIKGFLDPIHKGNVDFSKWGEFVQGLREGHKQLSSMFQEKYLRVEF